MDTSSVHHQEFFHCTHSKCCMSHTPVLLPLHYNWRREVQRDFPLPDCKGDARTLPNCTAALFISKFEGFCTFYDYKTVRGHTAKLHGGFFPPIFRAFTHFLTTRLHGGDHPDDGSFFHSRKPILFDNIIMHLLHSCTHCDLNHSYSLLHMSRDTVT